jgi:hypothetical protein
MSPFRMSLEPPIIVALTRTAKCSLHRQNLPAKDRISTKKNVRAGDLGAQTVPQAGLVSSRPQVFSLSIFRLAMRLGSLVGSECNRQLPLVVRPA